MKRKIIAFIASCIISIMLSAQGQQITNIAEARETLRMTEQSYQQLQNMIKQLQHQYEQTKIQIQNATDNNSDEINTKEKQDYIAKNIAFANDIEKRLKNIRITIGKGSYDLAAVYKVPGGMFAEILDARIQKLSDKEKARIFSLYRFDTVNNAARQTWGNEMLKEVEKLTALEEEVEKQYKQNHRDIVKMTEKSSSGDRITALLKAANNLHGNIHEQFQELCLMTVMDIGTLAEAKIVESDSKSTLTVSDDFFKLSPMPDLELKGDR